jgi:hypothetical protein
MEEREWTGYYDLYLVNLPLQRRRGVFIVSRGKRPFGGKTRDLGLNLGRTRNPTRNSRSKIRLQPKPAPEISGLNRAWNQEQTEPAQKLARAWLGLVRSHGRLNIEISVHFPVQFLV